MNIPPGQSAPFANITPQDHTAWIIISAALGFTLVLLFAAIRVFIRSWISSGYGFDDYAVAVSSCLAAIQAWALLAACVNGMGKSRELLASHELNKIRKLYYASDLLFIIALAPSKAAIGLFLYRLSPARKFRYVVLGLLGTLVIWAFISLFTMAFSCERLATWATDSSVCHDLRMRWIVVESIGCLLEAAFFTLSCWLVWGLKTARGNKGIVMFAFGSRLILIIVVGIRLETFHEGNITRDPTLHQAQFAAWTSVELTYSIVSATIPILRPFVNSLATNYGGGQGSSGHEPGYGNRSAANGIQSTPASSAETRSFAMKPLSRSKARASILQPESVGEYTVDCYKSVGAGQYSVGTRQPAGSEPSTRLSNGDGVSLDSTDSQRMIIRKDVTWHVNRDEDSRVL